MADKSKVPAYTLWYPPQKIRSQNNVYLYKLTRMCFPAVSNEDKNLNPFCSRMTFVTNRKTPCRKGGFGTQAADCPPPPTRSEGR
jgi:hypothetical protein